FGRLRAELFWEMAHWLGRKRHKSMPEVMKEYYEDNTFRTKSMKLSLPGDHETKRLLTKTWHNPYTAKEAIIRQKLIVLESLWSGEEGRHGMMDLREEAIAQKGTICAINGPDCASRGNPLHPSEVELDHIKLRAKFKNLKDAYNPTATLLDHALLAQGFM